MKFSTIETEFLFDIVSLYIYICIPWRNGYWLFIPQPSKLILEIDERECRNKATLQLVHAPKRHPSSPNNFILIQKLDFLFFFLS